MTSARRPWIIPCGPIQRPARGEEARDDHWGRLCVHAVPSGTVDRGRLLPRKPRLMSVNGGNRGGRGGKGKRDKTA